MDLIYPLIGFATGTLVGLTGVGGGSLTTPLLLLLSPFSPLTIVGTDLLFAFFTKLSASWAHIRVRNFEKKLILIMLIGSIIGAIGGISIVRWIETLNGGFPDLVITKTTGVVIIVVSILLLLNTVGLLTQKRRSKIESPVLLPIFGFIGGALVIMTSVGSGAMYLTFLMFLFPAKPVCVLIGTDIIHATFLTGFSAILHGIAGNINSKLLALLIVGSIPGTFIGSRFAIRAPQKVLRTFLSVYLFAVGILLSLKN